jgi:hypothetical protein
LEKQNKILIGLGIAVVGYLLLKPKASNKPVRVLKTNKDAQTNTISTSTTTETTTQASIVEKISIKNRPDIKSPEPYIITDQERLENSFTPKEFKNELSIDAFGNLNNFMTASDVYYIGGWAGGKGRPSDYLYTSTGIISS